MQIFFWWASSSPAILPFTITPVLSLPSHPFLALFFSSFLAVVGEMYPWDDFASNPLGEKGVESVPGVDAAIAGRLVYLGYDKAYILAGRLLTMRKDKVV